nr:MAG: ORF2 [Torque teno polar bear virus 47]
MSHSPGELHPLLVKPIPGTLSFKKQEAIWKKSIAETHKIFCSCPNYLLHFKWPTSTAAPGYASGSDTSPVVRGPLDGATIKGSGTGGDLEEAVAAAVSFLVDDKE